MLLPRIKDIRENMGMTQDQFSDYLTNEKHVKISRGTIAKYESGVNYPSKKTLQKLSNALNISEYYLSGEGPSKDEINKKILNLLHKSYFMKDYGGNKLHQAIKTYLGFKYKTNEPLSFYTDKNGNIIEFKGDNRFPQFDAINKFWQDEFSFLFSDKNFKASLVGTDDPTFETLVEKRIRKQFDKEVDNRNYSILIDTVDDLSATIKRDTLDVIHGTDSKESIQRDLKEAINRYQWMLNNFFENSNNKKG